MKRVIWLFILLGLLVSPVISSGCDKVEGTTPVNEGITIPLPQPAYDSEISIEEALLKRRSVSEYSEGALTLQQVGQLLWAAQGITDPSGKRTAPSAGALYPLEVYVVTGNVEGVTPGVYKYKADSHSLVKIVDGDRRASLASAANGQKKVGRGAIAIVITAVYDRTKQRYGDRGERYVQLEAGHAAQNIYLQAVSLNLGTVTVGDFDDSAVRQILNTSNDETPLYVMPVGRTGD
jgi:SagB-type dehydrogenase family enzyme